MRQVLTLFISTFSTLLAIINPLEALPVFLKLLEDEHANQHQQVARRSCLYACCSYSSSWFSERSYYEYSDALCRFTKWCDVRFGPKPDIRRRRGSAGPGWMERSGAGV